MYGEETVKGEVEHKVHYEKICDILDIRSNATEFHAESHPQRSLRRRLFVIICHSASTVTEVAVPTGT